MTADLTVTLLEPAQDAQGDGTTKFAWKPDGPVGDNDCFEIRFWERAPDEWVAGFGLAAATSGTSITVELGPMLEEQVRRDDKRPLRSGVTYHWGVLHVPCSPYEPPTELISDVREFTYNAR
jgi:hypothetical protein